jgi:hypothetical protein
VQRGELQVLESEALEHLEPALAGAELLGLRVVRWALMSHRASEPV